MFGAGRRPTNPPDRYNPSAPYPPTVLPNFDLSLSMSDLEEGQTPCKSPTGDDSDLDLRSLLKSFHAESQKQFEKAQVESQKQFEKSQDNFNITLTEIRKEITQITSHIFSILDRTEEECKAYTNRQVSEVKGELGTHITGLADRVCVLEGHSARLAAVEAAVQQLKMSPLVVPEPLVNKQPLSETQTSNTQKISFTPHMSSTIFSSSIDTSWSNLTFSNPLYISSSAQTNSSILKNIPFENRQISYSNNSSILPQEKFTDLVPEFNGHLMPLHPEAFLTEVHEYFQFQEVPDYFKINIVKRRLVGEAKQWFSALTPPPNTFTEFTELFRQHFWSYNRQLIIRNELPRPYTHRNTSTLQKHAIDWINKAKYLNPPIETEALIFQILSHFPDIVSSPLRILRIKTVNDLIDHLSYAEHFPRSFNNNNHSNNNSYTSHNNNSNNRHNNYQDRYQSQNRTNPQNSNTQNSNNINI